MKKQKNIDGLLTSLENQTGALMGKSKSLQHWCGLNITGGSFQTGSQVTNNPDNGDVPDCDDPGGDHIAAAFGG